jgi:hypothetical protein
MTPLPWCSARALYVMTDPCVQHAAVTAVYSMLPSQLCTACCRHSCAYMFPVSLTSQPDATRNPITPPSLLATTAQAQATITVLPAPLAPADLATSLAWLPGANTASVGDPVTLQLAFLDGSGRGLKPDASQITVTAVLQSPPAGIVSSTFLVATGSDVVSRRCLNKLTCARCEGSSGLVA